MENRLEERKNETEETLKIKKYLSQTLAICLSKVRREIGVETAERIISILCDDLFDITHFQTEISSLEKCEEVRNMIISGLKTK